MHTVLSSEDNLVEDMVKCGLLLIGFVCYLTSKTNAACTTMPKSKMQFGYFTGPAMQRNNKSTTVNATRRALSSNGSWNHTLHDDVDVTLSGMLP